MTTERDELARLIAPELPDVDIHGDVSHGIADVILAAGYRKPRTITTADELDALPDNSVVLFYGEVWQKLNRYEWWTTEAGTQPRTAREIADTANGEMTVLYVPEVTP